MMTEDEFVRNLVEKVGCTITQPLPPTDRVVEELIRTVYRLEQKVERLVEERAEEAGDLAQITMKAHYQ